MSEKGFYRKNITVEVVGGILATLLGGIIAAWLTGLWEYVAALPSYVWQFLVWLGEPVTVSRWWYWLLVAVAVAVVVFVLALVVSLLRRQPEPTYTEYTESYFQGMRWRWRWTKRGAIDQYSIAPFCPHDDMRLVYIDGHYNDSHFLCEKCRTMYNPIHNNRSATIEAVMRSIENDIRTDAWEQKIKTQRQV